MKGTIQDLGQRFVIASFLILCLSAMLFFAYLPGFYIIVLFFSALFAFFSCYELLRMRHFQSKLRSKMVSILSSAILVSFFVAGYFSLPMIWPFATFLVSFMIIFLSHFHRVEGAIRDIAISFFSLVYICVPIGLLIYILYKYQNFSPIDGRLWIALIVVLTKVSDIFAYFSGKIFGKNLLAKYISPNKTIEGALGGLFSVIALSVVVQYFFPTYSISYLAAALFGLIIGILSQIGDLCESLLKRDAKVKDSSNIPGIGGILDTLDSLLFTIPFFYIYITLLYDYYY